MAQFAINIGQVRPLPDSEAAVARKLSGYADEVRKAANGLGIQSSAASSIKSSLRSAAVKIDQHSVSMSGMSSALSSIVDKYEKTEQTIVSKAEENAGQRNILSEFGSEFQDNYGLGDLLKGSGYIGTIYGFVQDIRNGKYSSDFWKTGYDVSQFLIGAVDTYRRYKKIGRAVGGKKAMCWWAKNITGIKSLGRVSSAKNVFTRFKNNLTNKTSPFNMQLKENFKNVTGKNGVKKAGVAWAGILTNGVLNYWGNKEEQAASNGEMSNARVIAETITGTAVDTVIDYTESAVVGAAVTALCPVALPGVVVVAASGLVIAGINAGVKALTGKTTTEWVSDTILNIGGKIADATSKLDEAAAKVGEKVGKAARKVTDSIGKWFSNKFAFA